MDNIDINELKEIIENIAVLNISNKNNQYYNKAFDILIQNTFNKTSTVIDPNSKMVDNYIICLDLLSLTLIKIFLYKIK